MTQVSDALTSRPRRNLRLLLLALPAALVAWSRVELGDHTTAQVLAGTAMGVFVGGGSFWVLSQSL